MARKHLYSYETEYQYQDPVASNRCELRVFPRADMGVNISNEKIRIEPEHATKDEYTDRYGNRVMVIHISNPHTHMRFSYESTVEICENPAGFQNDDFLKEIFIMPSKYVVLDDVSRNIAKAMKAPEDVFQWMQCQFRFMPELTDWDTSSERVLRIRRGVCQDFTHAALAVLRAMNINSLYMSGFRAEGEHTHAWPAYFDKGKNAFLEMDVANNQIVDDTYLPLAIGRDYYDVPPVVGSYKGEQVSEMKYKASMVEL
jgi:transglutaminase-like putative cysteine protease